MRERQRAIRSRLADNTDAGYWRVVAYPPKKPMLDISMFRGKPVELGRFSFTDPFGPKAFTIRFPQITIFDKISEGDLVWLRKFANIDILWVGDLPPAYPFGRTIGGVWRPQWRWEGYIASFSWDPSLTIECVGAMRQLDDYQAKPEYPSRPLPYEWAISRQFLQKPALRLQPLRIRLAVLVDHHLHPAAEEDRALHDPGRGDQGEEVDRAADPLDRHLGAGADQLHPDPADLDVHRPGPVHDGPEHRPDPGAVPPRPGDVPGRRHRGDRPDRARGEAQPVRGLVAVPRGGLRPGHQSLAGNAYSGMQVSSDGLQTYYDPMAYRRQVHPTDADNNWLDKQEMRREVLVQMQPGLSADDAAVVARAHLARFGDPGVTGSIELNNTDPSMNGVPFPHALMRAGMAIHIPNLFGRPEGVLLHIAETETDFVKGQTTLTVDSKQRDALTVGEVRMRGRDALSISRMLVAGQYSPPVPDQLFPWNYAEGSGYIPSYKGSTALRLFKGMPDAERFPWEDWTKAHPPEDPKWRSCYVKIPAASDNANQNWASQPGPGGAKYGIPIRMAQSGQVRLLQVAAYDHDGEVLRVPFHVSFFTSRGVNYQSMPMIPAGEDYTAPGSGDVYNTGQRYPFGLNGFERYQSDGTLTNPKIPQTVESAGLVRAYGTYYEKAGYFPGSYAEGDDPTGLLVDETTWAFDLTQSGASSFDPYSPKGNLVNPMAGNLYAMFYCDAQNDQPVYFLGRMFRVEPGTG